MNILEIQESQLDIENRIIYLHGEDPVGDDAGDEPGVDYRMAAKFIKNINTLSILSTDPIYIHMSTIGGDWSYGMAIYDAIKNCPCKVQITAYAWARSMSSIILQAADERIMMPNASFMLHWGTDAVEGHYLAVKSTVEFNAKTEKIMLDIYTNRCQEGLFFKAKETSLIDIQKFIEESLYKKADWWLTAQEAVYYGFADKVATK